MAPENKSLDTIVCTAVEVASPQERALFIAQACGDDRDLKGRVDRLVTAHFGAGNFLEKPAAQRLAEDQGIQEPGIETQGDIPASGQEGEDLNFLAPADKPGVLGRLGHYEILGVIGHGGMGIVLRAFDEQLHRVVAIKVMAAPLASNANARQRFTREARAAAAIRNEHVTGIYAVEEAGPVPYLVMEYIDGVSLQERLDRDGPLEVKEILRIGFQAACGLAAAHQQGLVHRDIKPANILLENHVERVKLTDFGLARARDDGSLTQEGLVAGTPQYMSPEQAGGERLDMCSDLFSLGSVLYAMCTGQAPFRGSGAIAILKHVCEDTPRPICESNPDIPNWLATVIDKLHAKDPAHRYQSAAEVAELLSGYLAHLQHPSTASLPAGVTEAEFAKLPSRRAWVVAGALLLCLVAGLAWTEAAGVTSLRTTLTGLLPPSGADVGATNDNGKPDNGSATTLIDFPVGEVRRHVWPDRGAYFAGFSPDGRYYLATGEAKGSATVRVWELASGKLVMEVTGNEFALFTPDSKRLIAAGFDKQIHVWDLATCQEFARFGEHPNWILQSSLSPDGQHLLTGCNDGIVRLWDVAAGKEMARLESDSKLGYPHFCPGGKQFLTLDEGGTIRWWDLAQRKEIRRWQQPETFALGVLGFLPGGQRFVTTGRETLYFWDMAAEKETQAMQLVGKIAGLGFSPDGSRLFYTVQHDPMMRLLELPKGKELATFPTMQGAYLNGNGTVGFSPDGRFAVAASWSGVVYLWRLPDPPEPAKK